MANFKESLILFLLLCFHLGFSQNDCVNAIVSCGSTNFQNLAVEGAGIQEVTGANSCGSGEFNSLWIKVTIKTPGTLGFIITPENPSITVDFDFFVFGPGPDITCENLGMAISCSTTNPQASGATSNLTGMIESEMDSTEGPSANGNNFVRWLDVLEDETYYIVIDRAIGNGNFSLDWLGTATFSDPPVINESTSGALNLQLCDSDAIADESTEFDLTQSGSIAIGTQTNLLDTYYLTESDAIVGSNAIANPTNYSNTSNPQIVFIRLQNAISGCFTISDFSLNVTPFNLPDIPNLEECDDDHDGYAVFNLNSIRTIINTNPNNVVSFHHTISDNINLPDLYSNQIAFTNETLWVKVYNATTGCTAYKSFDIILNNTPTAIPSQLTQCDFEIFPDGITIFNLAQANDSLSNGDSSLVTHFFLNATDAVNNQNELDNTYNNITNPQILTVKVTNPTTGCSSITQLTLNVNVNPTTTVTLQSCDDSIEDGITVFNLADAGFENNGNSVTYYNSSNDALLEQNPIVTNQFSTQNVYVRVENGNDCIGIHVIHLEVSPLPHASIDINGILCTNLPNNSVVLTAQINNPANYFYLWTPGNSTTQQQTIHQPGEYTVTVTDVLSTCSQNITTQVGVSEAPQVNAMDIIDLVQVNSITVNTIGNGDYWYSLDDNPFQPSNFFDHVVPGRHTIVIEDQNGCGSITQTVFVLGIPPVFTPNGDGYQEIWTVKGIDPRTNSSTIMYIFNRYGKLLKQTTPMEGWDGTYNGYSIPADDYWYSIQFEDGRDVKGHFTLKR